MTGAILYQPSRKWRVGAAFGAAALLHFAAIAIASIHQSDQAKELPHGEDTFHPIDITDDFPLDGPTPPPDLPDPPPLPNPSADLFPDERPTSRPVSQQTTVRTAPIVKLRKSRTAGVQGLSLVRTSALSAPPLEYPYEARRQRVTGSGIVIMTVDSVSGQVTNVIMEESTGSLVLDNAAITGFRRWRFTPGTSTRVRSPITFTMTGAWY